MDEDKLYEKIISIGSKIHQLKRLRDSDDKYKNHLKIYRLALEILKYHQEFGYKNNQKPAYVKPAKKNITKLPRLLIKYDQESNDINEEE